MLLGSIILGFPRWFYCTVLSQLNDLGDAACFHRDDGSRCDSEGGRFDGLTAAHGVHGARRRNARGRHGYNNIFREKVVWKGFSTQIVGVRSMEGRRDSSRERFRGDVGIEINSQSESSCCSGSRNDVRQLISVGYWLRGPPHPDRGEASFGIRGANVELLPPPITLRQRNPTQY